MKFNSPKLEEALRAKRIIKEGLSVPAAAKEVGISKYQYTRAEKYGCMDIEVFTKLVAWLGTNPDDYFTGIIHPTLSGQDFQDINDGLVLAMKELDKYENSADKILSDRLELIVIKILKKY